MTGSIALDVVIGLVFIYLLYSLLATILQEIVATNILKLRSKILEEAITRMLDDDINNHEHEDLLSKKFYSMPLIKYMARKNDKPSYLTAKNFSKNIIDILRGDNPKAGDDFRTRIEASLTNGIASSINKLNGKSNIISQGDTFLFLQSLWADAQGDLEKFKRSLEQWFDDTMERATGWYKRRTQVILFFIGLFVAALFNVDTVGIIHKLSSDPKLREQLVQQASTYTKEHVTLKQELDNLIKSGAKGDTLSDAKKRYDEFEKQNNVLVTKASEMVKTDVANVNKVLALGWSKEDCTQWYTHIVGWLLTALALSLGAPFWFDLLNKLMKVRSSVSVESDTSSGTSSSPDKQTSVTIKG